MHLLADLDYTTVLYAALTMLGVAVLFTVFLGIANVKLAVQRDPKEVAIDAALPGANCGGCAFAGCSAYAAALAAGETTNIALCGPGGPAVAAAIADILGVEAGDAARRYPVVRCAADASQRLARGDYHGVPTCTEATLVAGVQGCVYGCLGFGDCFDACDYDAIRIVDGLPRIDYHQCTSCGACAAACPRGIIQMTPFRQPDTLVVACSNREPGKAVRQVCRTGCIACKACTRVADFFSVEDNLASIDYQQYDAPDPDTLQTAAAKCPTKVIFLVGQTAGQPTAAAPA